MADKRSAQNRADSVGADLALAGGPVPHHARPKIGTLASGESVGLIWAKTFGFGAGKRLGS